MHLFKYLWVFIGSPYPVNPFQSTSYFLTLIYNIHAFPVFSKDNIQNLLNKLSHFLQ